MPSFQDSAVIFFLALLLFGPKKLPELARYVGKLMGEFRRASSEFRLQMEDEFRLSEQAEQQKKIAAIEAAAPVAPTLDIPEPEHPHIDPPLLAAVEDPAEPIATEPPAPVPIATSGDLHMMPPASGLPVARGANPFGFIPHMPDPEPVPAPEATPHWAETSQTTGQTLAAPDREVTPHA